MKSNAAATIDAELEKSEGELFIEAGSIFLWIGRYEGVEAGPVGRPRHRRRAEFIEWMPVRLLTFPKTCPLGIAAYHEFPMDND